MKDIKTMNNDELRLCYKEYSDELVDAVRTLDLPTFKAFWHKWKRAGLFSVGFDSLPSDHVLEITIRKLAVNLHDRDGHVIPNETRNEAAAWLLSNDYDLFL